MIEIVSLFLLAVGLSADSFAVSVTSGLILKKIDFFRAVKIATFLAFFQAVMPLVGWVAGYQVKDYIVEVDHWVAFGLLSILGIRMIFGSFRKSGKEKTFNPLNIAVLIGLSVATSIDALIVGVSFAFIDNYIWLPVLMIGFVTFIISMLGILFGKKASLKFGKKMETVGGIIIILIGFKILIEHLYF